MIGGSKIIECLPAPLQLTQDLSLHDLFGGYLKNFWCQQVTENILGLV